MLTLVVNLRHGLLPAAAAAAASSTLLSQSLCNPAMHRCGSPTWIAGLLGLPTALGFSCVPPFTLYTSQACQALRGFIVAVTIIRTGRSLAARPTVPNLTASQTAYVQVWANRWNTVIIFQAPN